MSVIHVSIRARLLTNQKEESALHVFFIQVTLNEVTVGRNIGTQYLEKLNCNHWFVRKTQTVNGEQLAGLTSRGK